MTDLLRITLAQQRETHCPPLLSNLKNPNILNIIKNNDDTCHINFHLKTNFNLYIGIRKHSGISLKVHLVTSLTSGDKNMCEKR